MGHRPAGPCLGRPDFTTFCYDIRKHDFLSKVTFFKFFEKTKITKIAKSQLLERVETPRFRHSIQNAILEQKKAQNGTNTVFRFFAPKARKTRKKPSPAAGELPKRLCLGRHDSATLASARPWQKGGRGDFV